MAAPSLITELSQTPGSNGPDGASTSPSELDDYQRAHASFIAQLRDGKGHAATASVASATTTDIGAVNSLSVEITGTTTITSLGATYSGPRLLRFAGVLTLTHSASLNLPGAANIVTAAGDTCLAAPNLAANGWNVIAYTRNSALPVYPGSNSTITSLSGLTTPLSVAQGGTGLAVAGTTFSAYLSASGGSVSNATFTKALFDTEIWDANGEFASSRFTATVPGYYQINAAMQLSAPAPGFLSIYKNGSEYKRGAWPSATGGAQDFAVAGQIKLAAADYVEIYIFQSSGGALTPQGVSTVTWFDGHFVRGL